MTLALTQFRLQHFMTKTTKVHDLIYKDKSRRLKTIGRERSNRTLIGRDSQWTQHGDGLSLVLIVIKIWNSLLRSHEQLNSVGDSEINSSTNLEAHGQPQLENYPLDDVQYHDGEHHGRGSDHPRKQASNRCGVTMLALSHSLTHFNHRHHPFTRPAIHTHTHTHKYARADKLGNELTLGQRKQKIKAPRIYLRTWRETSSW